MFSLGFFGSHNATIAIAKNNVVLEVVEIERLSAKKNAALWFYYSLAEPYNIRAIYEVRTYFEEKYGAYEFESVVYNSVDQEFYKIFPAKTYKWIGHHLAHAYSGMYQSPYDEALVVSFDGGSDEGYFNIFLGKKGNDFTKIYTGTRDLAVPYGLVAHHIQDIKQEEIFWGNLVYAGKLMGYANYGTIRDDFVEKLFRIYNNGDAGDIEKTSDTIVQILGISSEFRFSGQDAMDLAASNQYVFEYIFQEEIAPYLQQYPDLPVILVGGCGLNILNNTKLAQVRTVFVPPNPNDCGIALGLVASAIIPEAPIDATYLGPNVWDRTALLQYVFQYRGKPLDISELTEYLISGKIIGVVRGRSEHGPRALGNRSILCNPTFPYMKNLLNEKVKGREWYRPFAPVVRLEDVNKYFEWNGESRWMSFCPKVRGEYKDKLSAIVHIDGTARVQTVTREQNAFLYDLLTELHNKTGIGVLLNTSFNVAGKPILNTYKEATNVFNSTFMDGLILEDFLILKEN